MGAAMLGGKSGHAGLFGTAEDLAQLMQLLLQNGRMGGIEYLSPETVKLFTTRPENSNRRALGFDMQNLNYKADPNISTEASKSTFGHTGFTGTAVWVDPEYDLIYVFLSNRTYPSMNNGKLIRLDTRNKIHTAIYNAINSNMDLRYLSMKGTVNQSVD